MEPSDSDPDDSGWYNLDAPPHNWEIDGTMHGDEDLVSGPVPSLIDTCAITVAEHFPYEVIEKVDRTVPDEVLLRITFWSFPTNQRLLLLYTQLNTGKDIAYYKGIGDYNSGLVFNVTQIGYCLSGCVLDDNSGEMYSVVARFDRCYITGVKCSCSTKKWCSHVVSLCLHRIEKSNAVPMRLPLKESLARLDKDDLLKFCRRLINDIPHEYLSRTQTVLDNLSGKTPDEMLKCDNARDQTAGGVLGELCGWILDLDKFRDTVRSLVKKLGKATAVLPNEVYPLGMKPPLVTQEFDGLYRPLQYQIPLGLWNIIDIIRQLIVDGDRNSLSVLYSVTVELLSSQEVVDRWFCVDASLSGENHPYYAKFSPTSNGTIYLAQKTTALYCNKVVYFWRCAMLNPLLTRKEKDHFRKLFQDWHMHVLYTIWYHSRSLHCTPSKYHPYVTDMCNFPGFKPAIEACDIEWDNFNVPTIDSESKTRRFDFGLYWKYDGLPFAINLDLERRAYTYLDMNGPVKDVLKLGMAHSHRLHSIMDKMNAREVQGPCDIDCNPILKFLHDQFSASRCIVNKHIINSFPMANSFTIQIMRRKCVLSDILNFEITNNGVIRDSSTESVVKSNANDGGNMEKNSSIMWIKNIFGSKQLLNSDRLGEKVVFETYENGSLHVIMKYDIAKIFQSLWPTNSSVMYTDSSSDVETWKNQSLYAFDPSNVVGYGIRSQNAGTLEVNTPFTPEIVKMDPQNAAVSSVSNQNVENVATNNGEVLQCNETSESVKNKLTSSSQRDNPTVREANIRGNSRNVDEFGVLNSALVNRVAPVSNNVEEVINQCPISMENSIIFDVNEFVSEVCGTDNFSESECLEKGIFDDIFKDYKNWDLLYAYMQGLYLHVSKKRASVIAVKLAEMILSRNPSFKIKQNLTKNKKRKGFAVNPMVHIASLLAYEMLSKMYDIILILSKTGHEQLASQVGLCALELARPAAALKSLEANFYDIESKIFDLISAIPVGEQMMDIIKEKAERMLAHNYTEKGDVLLPNLVALYFITAANNRNLQEKYEWDFEELCYNACIECIYLKPKVYEADHPMLCESTRKQRQLLSVKLLELYRDDNFKLAEIMNAILDDDLDPWLGNPVEHWWYTNKDIATLNIDRAISDSYFPLKRWYRKGNENRAYPINAYTLSHFNAIPSVHFSSPIGDFPFPQPPIKAKLLQFLEQANVEDDSELSLRDFIISPPVLRDRFKGGYKGKRCNPNQPTEALAYHMFELAVLLNAKAGGYDLFAVMYTEDERERSMHPRLDLCALQIAMFSAGISSAANGTFTVKTRAFMDWLPIVMDECGYMGYTYLLKYWHGHFNPSEILKFMSQAFRSADLTIKKFIPVFAFNCLMYTPKMGLTELFEFISYCRNEGTDFIQEACHIIENVCQITPMNEQIQIVPRAWLEMLEIAEQRQQILDVSECTEVERSVLLPTLTKIIFSFLDMVLTPKRSNRSADSYSASNYYDEYLLLNLPTLPGAHPVLEVLSNSSSSPSTSPISPEYGVQQNNTHQFNARQSNGSPVLNACQNISSSLSMSQNCSMNIMSDGPYDSNQNPISFQYAYSASQSSVVNVDLTESGSAAYIQPMRQLHSINLQQQQQQQQIPQMQQFIRMQGQHAPIMMQQSFQGPPPNLTSYIPPQIIIQPAEQLQSPQSLMIHARQLQSLQTRPLRMSYQCQLQTLPYTPQFQPRAQLRPQFQSSFPWVRISPDEASMVQTIKKKSKGSLNLHLPQAATNVSDYFFELEDELVLLVQDYLYEKRLERYDEYINDSVRRKLRKPELIKQHREHYEKMLQFSIKQCKSFIEVETRLHLFHYIKANSNIGPSSANWIATHSAANPTAGISNNNFNGPSSSHHFPLLLSQTHLPQIKDLELTDNENCVFYLLSAYRSSLLSLTCIAVKDNKHLYERNLFTSHEWTNIKTLMKAALRLGKPWVVQFSYFVEYTFQNPYMYYCLVKYLANKFVANYKGKLYQYLQNEFKSLVSKCQLMFMSHLESRVNQLIDGDDNVIRDMNTLLIHVIEVWTWSRDGMMCFDRWVDGLNRKFDPIVVDRFKQLLTKVIKNPEQGTSYTQLCF